MDQRMRDVIRRRPGWQHAMSNLEHRLAAKGSVAIEAADRYGDVYAGRRAAMVVDVVASRQRKYETRVKSMVAAFEARCGTATLRSLADAAGDPVPGLRTGEGNTMRSAAREFLRFGEDRNLHDDDVIVRAWADATEGLDVAHELDPYVGHIKGVGPALFAYMRMRSGGDGLKPDLRVRGAMNELGFAPPVGDVALLMLCRAVAAELGVPMLVLDQLLWAQSSA